jgi:hypothetical protein
MDLLAPGHRNGLVSPGQSQTADHEHPLGSTIVVSSLFFPATFKSDTGRGFCVCVSSRDPSNQIPFNRALRNQRAPILQFVSVLDKTSYT